MTVNQRKRCMQLGNLCPVKILLEYIARLNMSCDNLFQRPNAAFHKGKAQWFDNVPRVKHVGTWWTSYLKKSQPCVAIAVREGSIESYRHDTTTTKRRLLAKTLASCMNAYDSSRSEPCTSGSTFVNRVTTFRDSPPESILRNEMNNQPLTQRPLNSLLRVLVYSQSENFHDNSSP